MQYVEVRSSDAITAQDVASAIGGQAADEG
jgi:hypothetical protein